MDQSRDKRIMSLVHACIDMSGPAREEFLRVECDDDSELRSAVEQLLDEEAKPTGMHATPSHITAALPEYYRVIELIGSGGMADVFLATDLRLDRRVAIKFLNETFRSDPERMRRFKQEAKSASALNHPNIITIHDIGESDGVQYIVSEFVDGETLAARMTRGRLVLSEAVDIAIQIASALDASHQAGIVHRDLKPENIMLRRDGGLKVVDFGLAKGSAIFGHRGETLEVVTTSPGMILGTPRYMSPEQTRGLPLDGRSDIFSFGIILFEMVTGRTPFPGNTAADTIAAILSREPRKIDELINDPPANLVNIINRCLQKNPENRYRSMGAVLGDLQELRGGMVTAARTTQADVPAAAKSPLWKLLWLSFAALALVAAGIVGWTLYGRGRSGIMTTGALRNVTVTSWSTFSAENVTSASFSPDSKMVAFASTKSGASEIWSKPTASGDPIQVTRNGSRNLYPLWSPDGQEIAFFSKRGQDQGIWRVSFTGGQETELIGGTSFVQPLRWSTDGRIFVWEKDKDKDNIFTITPGSADRRQLVSFSGTDVHPRAIAVSGDGAAIAVSTKEGDEWKLKYKRFDASGFSDIATFKDPIDSIAFHPNGTSIFFSGGKDGTEQVFETTTRGETPVQISSGATDVALQDVSAEGYKILCSSISETSDLWLVNAADGKAQVVANDVSEEFWPTLSPDGRNVAYETTPQADHPFRGSVLVRSLDSASSQVLAKDGFAPMWSGDGKWIAYYNRSESGISISKVRPSGADATKVVNGPVIQPGYYSTPYLITAVSYLAWSPDSASLAYVAPAGGGNEIFFSPADASAPPRQLSANGSGGKSTCPIWTRDGSAIIFYTEPIQSSGKDRVFTLSMSALGQGQPRVVFTSKDPFQLVGNAEDNDSVLIAQRSDPTDASQAPAETKIFAVSLRSGTAKPVTVLKKAYFSNLHLSLDGRTLAFVTRSNDVTELWTVPTGGGTPKRIFTDNDPKVLISTLAWSPDGKSIIFGKQTRTNVLSILTN